MSNFHFTQTDVQRLESQAQQLRRDIVSMIHAAKAGHPGGLPVSSGNGHRSVLPCDEHRSLKPRLA